jgi:hypothetical protein
MNWAEELPPQCPPSDAVPPHHEAYYRYVDAIPLTDGAFHSQRKLFPMKAFNVEECIARSVSIFSNPEKIKNWGKLPNFKGKTLVEIVLTPDSGVILRTGTRADHFSWWRVNGFYPGSCKVVTT